MASLQRRHHWDKRKRRYIQLQPQEAVKAGKRVKLESGAKAKGEEAPSGLYQKWAKAHKRRMTAPGEEESGAAAAYSKNLANRFVLASSCRLSPSGSCWIQAGLSRLKLDCAARTHEGGAGMQAKLKGAQGSYSQTCNHYLLTVLACLPRLLKCARFWLLLLQSWRDDVVALAMLSEGCADNVVQLRTCICAMLCKPLAGVMLRVYGLCRNTAGTLPEDCCCQGL